MKFFKLLLMVCLIVLLTMVQTVFPQSIDEEYKKSDSKDWGDIFSWVFGNDRFNKSYALVIGIGDYKNGWSSLEAPYNDATRVRDYLIKDAGFDYVVTITNEKATKKKIYQLMEEEFPDLIHERDRFLFYFSGHGAQRYKGDSVFGYLVLQNCGLKSYADMITMEDIERWDRLLYQTKHVIFVLDCCFSGIAGIQNKSPLTDKKLDRLSKYAHHVVTAGLADEESVASNRLWGGSLFTDSFLKAVSGRADMSSRDYGQDGVVSLKELIQYIGERIDEESLALKAKNPLSKGIKLSPVISDLQNNEGEFFFITRNIKNKKAGNVSEKNLDYGWPIETKGTRYVTQIQNKAPGDNNKGSLSESSSGSDKFEITQFEVMLPTVLNGDTVLISKKNNLMWRPIYSRERLNASKAGEQLAKLNTKGYAGYKDWRKPRDEELMSYLLTPKSTRYWLDKLPTDIWTFEKEFDAIREGELANKSYYLLAVRSIKKSGTQFDK